MATWLTAHPTLDQARLVRPNPLATAWGRDDLAAVVGSRPDGLVIPKAESRADLDAIDRLLCALEEEHGLARRSIALIPIATETARAALHVEEIARAPRVAALTWGAEDLSAALGAQATRDEDGAYLDVFRAARVNALLAARAAGVEPIDGVYTDFADAEGLEREAIEAARMGFAGKLTIHPSQIPIVNAVFTPSDLQIAHCRALLAAWEAHRKAGRGAFSFEGQMVDAPHVARARGVLARARAVTR